VSSIVPTCRAVRCERHVIAVKVWGVLGEMERDRQCRPFRAARVVRLDAPSRLPCTPKCPSWGVTCKRAVKLHARLPVMKSLTDMRWVKLHVRLPVVKTSTHMNRVMLDVRLPVVTTFWEAMPNAASSTVRL
jgi:hypothetical protein